jgi:hypothetical protein
MDGAQEQQREGFLLPRGDESDVVVETKRRLINISEPTCPS